MSIATPTIALIMEQNGKFIFEINTILIFFRNNMDANEAFPSSYPSLITCAQTMKERARDRVRSIERKIRENNNVSL